MLLSVNNLYRFDDFVLDPANRSFSRAGTPIPLSAKSCQVLAYLVANPGRVVTKDELLKAVWANSFVEESNLPGYISGLRKAMGDRAGYIATVPGLGYKFTASVEMDAPPDLRSRPAELELQQMRETTHVIIRETSSPVPALPKPKPLLLRWAFWVPMAAVLALSTGAGYAVWRYEHRVETPPLVVLSDFENATGDPQLDKVLDGALEIDLKQSPYLSFLSNAKVQETIAQMQRPKNTPLSADIAREVCQRNNAQVSLHGVVAKFGQRYLLTLRATDCQSGDELAQTKSEAAVADDIPHTIDVVAADMRKRLGESRSSIRQYNVPLFAENTNSLEALRRFSEASHLGLQGKYSEAIPLYQRAIDLDPNFAVAYADMATVYGNLGDRAHENANLTKAYQLRNSVAERDRLYITARYAETVTGDLQEGIANYRLWTAIYPRNAVPWTNLGNAYTQLGEPELAVAPARQAIALNPANAAGYVILGRALMHAGHLDEAKTVCEQAIAKGVAGGDLHSLLMEIAVARGDAAGIQQQITWAAASPDSSRMKLNQALLAFARGQVKLGRQLMDETAAYYNQKGMPAVGARYLLASARMLAEEGYPEEAKKLVDTLVFLPGLTDPVVAMAEVGEPDRAAEILKQEMSQHPQDTLWLGYKGPQIQAAISLAEHKPQQAIAALGPATALDLRDFDTLLLRGNAYLAAQQPAPAEQEFRKILDHPGIDPFSYEYPLAQLGLARALAAQKNLPASIAAYQNFFTMWKDADTNLPVLLLARREYSNLNAIGTGTDSLDRRQNHPVSSSR